MLQTQTELDAINYILQIIGEQPVNSLPVEGFYTASLAQNTLNNVSREIQSRGCSFNTDINYSLAQDVSGQVTIPQNILGCNFKDSMYVQRANKVYNIKEHTYTINTNVICDIVWFLDFNDLPQYAKGLITIKAARKLLVELIGSDTLLEETKQQEYEAELNFHRQEILTLKASMSNNAQIANTCYRNRY